MTIIRAFFAINLSVNVVREISAAQKIAASRCVENGWNATWLAPPNQHLILRYLGEISQALPHAIQESLRTPVEAFAPFAVEARGLGIREVTVDGAVQRRIVVHVTDVDEALEKLQASLTQPLEELGFKGRSPELDRHIVIGNVFGNEGSTPLEVVLEGMHDKEFGTSNVRELTLYRSDAHAPKGEFLRLWHVPFLGTNDTDSASPDATEKQGLSNDETESADIETISEPTPSTGPPEGDLENERPSED